MTVWDLRSIEGGFARAATNSRQWSAALQNLTQQTASYGAILFPVTGGPDFGMPHTDEVADSLEAYFRNGWYQRDERYKGITTLIAQGVVDDLDIFSEEAIGRHPYYQEFLAPFKLKWFAGLKVAVGNDLWCISLQRRPDQGPFSPSEKQSLALLAQSISCHAAMAQATGSAAVDGALDAFEASNKAVLLVNGYGDVVRMNAAAEKLMDSDFKVLERQIVGFDRVSSHSLKKAIQDLAIGRAVSVSVPIVFTRTLRRPILAYPLRLDRSASYFFTDCKLAIILVDMERPLRTKECELRTIFHMTASEARLAARLLSGETLERVADELGIAKETARNHLKTIFEKAEVNRQSELLALLARLSGPPR